MELSSQEPEMPIPISSTTYGGERGNGHGQEGHGNMAHHHLYHRQDPSNGSSIKQPALLDQQDHGPYMKKKEVRYRECLKNHAASMGGNALDGCGEFMPSGEEGTIEALTCSACHCHRNFHRKEVEGESSYYKFGRKFFLGDHHNSVLAAAPEALVGYPTGNILPSRTVPPHQMILPYNVAPGPLPSESDEQEDGGGGIMVSRPASSQIVKKRFRTKFTQEQKERMLDFAEKVGWKIQKQEESVVQQFCQEIGVRRRVLKVWMHNNKHNLAKKIINPPPPPPPTSTTATA
ncbi:zinc-finger homeodomain protein 3-like [Neltuma alba]|uniref:zinc-finger homeodomain protein 3-like n=1 Tax=Neltuma alba TaxID=207710 RepID=UPI0010A3E272|nr:zinc-finger homeodomain protein 3-like [Prosopis alba]XP_028762855.1 zinc-finger homeodomain protein 3-like [Prosopis alba]